MLRPLLRSFSRGKDQPDGRHRIVLGRKSTTNDESGRCALVLRQCRIVILMPDLMRTLLLLYILSHRCFGSITCQLPASKLRSYLHFARAGSYPDSRRMQSTVRRRQHRAPPAKYVPCFSRASQRHYPVTRCCSVRFSLHSSVWFTQRAARQHLIKTTSH